MTDILLDINIFQDWHYGDRPTFTNCDSEVIGENTQRIKLSVKPLETDCEYCPIGQSMCKHGTKFWKGFYEGWKPSDFSGKKKK